jgi:solute:Na+ symporter, SSS family
MKSMIHIDYVIIALYMLTMALIGVFVSRFNKNDSDYFKGGNKVPWLMSGLSFFIGGFSAYMFVAASAKAYHVGPACLVLFTSAAYGCIFSTIFLVKRWRRARITSPMEYVELRYGPITRSVFTFIQIPAYCLMLGSWLYVLCIFVSSALGLTANYTFLGINFTGLQLCMIVTGIVIVFYTTAGGLWAVVVTDTVQFCIVMVVAAIVLPLSLKALAGDGSILDGVRNFIDNPPTKDYFKLIKPSQTISFALAFGMVNSISIAGHLASIQRASCVPDEASARKVGALASILLVLSPIFWVLPVFIMRPLLPNMDELWPQLNNPYDGTYVSITRMLLPNGMIGLTVAAIFAATMSTMSTMYNILSAIFTENVYKPLFGNHTSPKTMVWTGRMATLCFGVISIVLGFLLSSFQDAFNTTLTIAAQFGIVFAFPIIVGAIVKRVPWWTALVSMPACLAYTLSVQYLVPAADTAGLTGLVKHMADNSIQYKIFGAVGVNAIVFIICAFFYNAKTPGNLKAAEFFELIKKPVSEDENAKLIIPNLNTYRIVGWTMALFGVCILVIKITGLSKDPQNINLIASAMFIAVFGVIQWLTSPKYSPIKLVKEQLQQPVQEPGEDIV